MYFLLVFLGGGLGAISRYGISLLFVESTKLYPWSTFIANTISCLALGLLLGYYLQKGMDQKMSLFFITGFCGGFSTFSSFNYDSFKLIQDGQVSMAVTYIAASVLLCLLCLLIGIKLYTGLNS